MSLDDRVQLMVKAKLIDQAMADQALAKLEASAGLAD